MNQKFPPGNNSSRKLHPEGIRHLGPERSLARVGLVQGGVHSPDISTGWDQNKLYIEEASPQKERLLPVSHDPYLEHTLQEQQDRKHKRLARENSRAASSL